MYIQKRTEFGMYWMGFAGASCRDLETESPAGYRDGASVTTLGTESVWGQRQSPWEGVAGVSSPWGIHGCILVNLVVLKLELRNFSVSMRESSGTNRVLF